MFFFYFRFCACFHHNVDGFPLKQDTQTPATAHASVDSRGSIATKNIDRHYEEDRKFNVVIHGIEECCKGTPKYERLKHDLEEVTCIITNTQSSISPLSI